MVWLVLRHPDLFMQTKSQRRCHERSPSLSVKHQHVFYSTWRSTWVDNENLYFRVAFRWHSVQILPGIFDWQTKSNILMHHSTICRTEGCFRLHRRHLPKVKNVLVNKCRWCKKLGLMGIDRVWFQYSRVWSPVNKYSPKSVAMVVQQARGELPAGLYVV